MELLEAQGHKAQQVQMERLEQRVTLEPQGHKAQRVTQEPQELPQALSQLRLMQAEVLLFLREYPQSLFLW